MFGDVITEFVDRFSEFVVTTIHHVFLIRHVISTLCDNRESKFGPRFTVPGEERHIEGV